MSNQPVMYILRGAPGSGKSTLAKELVKGTNGVVYSTDDFFMNGDKYDFNPSKLGENHRKNQRRAEIACLNGISPIVIDNTNTQKFEAKPYVQLAQKYGYKIEFLEATAPWSKDVEELARRNTHGVPKDSIEKMLGRYEPHEDFTEEKILKSRAPWEK